jgi:hypothetical protein
MMGKSYIVWDKSASIAFKRPGTTDVTATFHVSQALVDELKRELLTKSKVEPVFNVNVVDDKGDVVAEIVKTLSIRNKAPKVDSKL